MSNNSCYQKMEEIAQKHGKTSNPKCNFKYLMKGKTDRNSRHLHASKENQIESVLLNSAHKYALKTARVRTVCQESQPLISPITSFDVFLGHSPTQQPETIIKKSQPESIEHLTVLQQSFSSANKDEMLELESKMNLQKDRFEQEQKSNKATDFACLTEECYYTKELEIKIQLLQKERDDIWNSIAETIKENMALKEIIANFTINKKTTSSTSVQSDSLATLQVQVQTDITSSQLSSTEHHIKKIQQQTEQAKVFCLTIARGLDDKNEEQQNLKSLISSTINSTITQFTAQWQKEKEILHKVHLEELNKYKQKMEENAGEINKLIEAGKEKDRIKINMEKIYQKELEQITSAIQLKEKKVMEEIYRFKNQVTQMQYSHQKQNKLCLQYMENVNNSWAQKQRLYSVLLSQAHKTIKSLMSQMKEFQSLANENYSKYLKAQRSLNVWKMVEDIE